MHKQKQVATVLTGSDVGVLGFPVPSIPTIPAQVLKLEEPDEKAAEVSPTKSVVSDLSAQISSPARSMMSNLSAQISSPATSVASNITQLSPTRSIASSISAQTTPGQAGMRNMFKNMRKFGPPPSTLRMRRRSGSISSALSTPMSQASMKAYRNRPIQSRTLISLKKIREKMGDQQELFTDESMIGFNKRKWKSVLFKKAPIHFHDGLKTDLGRWIKASYSQKSRNIMVIVNAKASEIQLNKLIYYLETTAPLFRVCQCLIKTRRAYEQITELYGWQGLRDYIESFLIGRKNMNFKVEW